MYAILSSTSFIEDMSPPIPAVFLPGEDGESGAFIRGSSVTCFFIEREGRLGLG